MRSIFIIVFGIDKRYGDGAGNTIEENSSVFSLIQMRYALQCTSCLQCFDTVGWVAGRASGL